MKKVVSILLSVLMIMSVVIGTSAFAESTDTTEMCKVNCGITSNVFDDVDDGFSFLTNKKQEVEKGKPYSTNIKFRTDYQDDEIVRFNVVVIMGDGTIIEPIVVEKGNLLVTIPKVTDDIYIFIKSLNGTSDAPITGGMHLFVWDHYNVSTDNPYSYENKSLHSGTYIYNLGKRTYCPKEGYKITSIKMYAVNSTYEVVSNKLTYTEKDCTNPDDGYVTNNGDGTYTISGYYTDDCGYYLAIDTEPIETPTLPTKPAVKKVTKVSLNKKSVTLVKGKSMVVKATVTPSNATNKKLKWTTSNTKIATVNAGGKITAKSKGVANIKAMATDGSKKYATLKVTVKQPVTSVKLNRNTATLKLKGKANQKTVTLKATVNPQNASNKAVTWKSTKTNIATVNAKGKVTAKKKGTCYITVTAKDGSKKSAKCKITVK